MLSMQNFGFMHKLVAMVWCPLSTKGQGAFNHTGGEIVGENLTVGKILEELVKEKNKDCTMDGRRHSKPSSPNCKLWCVMDSKHNKCAPIVMWKWSKWWCDAQGMNWKIWSHPKHNWIGKEDSEDET